MCTLLFLFRPLLSLFSLLLFLFSFIVPFHSLPSPPHHFMLPFYLFVSFLIFAPFCILSVHFPIFSVSFSRSSLLPPIQLKLRVRYLSSKCQHVDCYAAKVEIVHSQLNYTSSAVSYPASQVRWTFVIMQVCWRLCVMWDTNNNTT